jgi:hypothetical protein
MRKILGSLRFYSTSLTSMTLAFSLAFLGPAVNVASAGSVSTQALLESGEMSRPEGRERLHQLVDRQDVARQLAAAGVSLQEAHRRIEVLSDAQVASLNGRIDELPAGGWVGAVVGAILIVFLVLLFTDLVGATDVFPWVNKN